MKFVRSMSKIVMLPFLDGMYTVHYQIRSRHIDFLALKLKSQASPLSGLPMKGERLDIWSSLQARLRVDSVGNIVPQSPKYHSHYWLFRCSELDRSLGLLRLNLLLQDVKKSIF